MHCFCSACHNYILGRAQYLIKSVISFLTVWEIAYSQFSCDIIIHLISLWFYIFFFKGQIPIPKPYILLLLLPPFFSFATIKSKTGKQCLKERMMHQGSLKKRCVVFPNYIQRVCQQWSTVNESIHKLLSVCIFLYSKPQRDLSAKGESKRKSN